MSVSVHVNDAMRGRPATGIAVRLLRDAGGSWVEAARSVTDEGGLVSGWRNSRLTRGVYQLEIDLDGYFASLGTISHYPAVLIRFRVLDPDYEQHVSVLVTPSAYFTYLQADSLSAGQDPRPRGAATAATAAAMASEEVDGGGY